MCVMDKQDQDWLLSHYVNLFWIFINSHEQTNYNHNHLTSLIIVCLQSSLKTFFDQLYDVFFNIILIKLNRSLNCNWEWTNKYDWISFSFALCFFLGWYMCSVFFQAFILVSIILIIPKTVLQCGVHLVGYKWATRGTTDSTKKLEL